MRATGFCPSDRLDVPADAARARPHRTSRSGADDLLLHRRLRVELARGAADRPQRGGDVPARRPRVRHVREAARGARRRSARSVHLFPFGVKFETFEEARAGAAPSRRPTSRALKRPIVGYVGGLHQWIDQDLVVRRRAAAARRDVRVRRPAAVPTCRGSSVRQHHAARREAARRPAGVRPRVRRRHRAVPAERLHRRTSTRRS